MLIDSVADQGEAGARVARVSERYAAFTFCDRIVELVPATSARAQFLLPSTIDEFPSCLVAEATGQLAAWVAMSHIEFRGRPVAALAGETRFLAGVEPGQTLHLEVAIEHCDDETVAYGGRAMVDGATVLELHDCVGPMLPQTEYDDPTDLARQFEVLRGAGAQPGRFKGVTRPALMHVSADDQARRARLDVPAHAAFFGDHFPRRPVFPATLLLDGLIRVATELLATRSASAGVSWQLERTKNVKVRDFVLPGQSVTLGAELSAIENGIARVALTATVGERTVATARAEFGARPEAQA